MALALIPSTSLTCALLMYSDFAGALRPVLVKPGTQIEFSSAYPERESLTAAPSSFYIVAVATGRALECLKIHHDTFELASRAEAEGTPIWGSKLKQA